MELKDLSRNQMLALKRMDVQGAIAVLEFLRDEHRLMRERSKDTVSRAYSRHKEDCISSVIDDIKVRFRP